MSFIRKDPNAYDIDYNQYDHDQYEWNRMFKSSRTEDEYASDYKKEDEVVLDQSQDDGFDEFLDLKLRFISFHKKNRKSKLILN